MSYLKNNLQIITYKLKCNSLELVFFSNLAGSMNQYFHPTARHVNSQSTAKTSLPAFL